MRIIHTSDWHLGHVLYGYPREEAHKDMLRQVVHLVEEWKPDALVI